MMESGGNATVNRCQMTMLGKIWLLASPTVETQAGLPVPGLDVG